MSLGLEPSSYLVLVGALGGIVAVLVSGAVGRIGPAAIGVAVSLLPLSYHGA